MKSTFVKILAALLAVMMCAALASCGGNGDSATTTTGTSKAADTTTSTAATTTSAKATSDTSKVTTTTEATTTTTEEVVDTGVEPAPEGLIVYYQDFNGIADSTDEANSNKILETLGWKRLVKEADGVYNEGDAYFFVEGGRLLVQNYYPGDENKDKVGPNGAPLGKDGYYKLSALTDEIMKRVVAGKYTLQYEVEYTTASAGDRYLNFITELSADGQCYNSFHFRNRGNANDQCHFYGSWYTYDAYDASTDAFCAATNDTDEATIATKGHSLLWKLTKGEKNYDSKVQAFSCVPVVIRIQHDPDVGQTVYMKLTTQTEFTLVAAPADTAAGAVYWNAWDDGYSIAFKLGGKQNGYIDNVCIWTGFGEQPAGKEATFKG